MITTGFTSVRATDMTTVITTVCATASPLVRLNASVRQFVWVKATVMTTVFLTVRATVIIRVSATGFTTARSTA